MANLHGLAFARCPKCGARITNVTARIESSHHSFSHNHAVIDTLRYTYEPCGHANVKAAPPERCSCETIVMRTTPELLAQWDADARKGQNSAHALAIAVICMIVLGLVAIGVLAWTQIR